MKKVLKVICSILLMLGFMFASKAYSEDVAWEQTPSGVRKGFVVDIGAATFTGTVLVQDAASKTNQESMIAQLEKFKYTGENLKVVFSNSAIGISGTVASTQSGTWNIGSITTLPDVTIGSGTVTANAGTNLNTSALALEAGGNLASIAGEDFATQTTLNLLYGKIPASPSDTTHQETGNTYLSNIKTALDQLKFTGNDLNVIFSNTTIGVTATDLDIRALTAADIVTAEISEDTATETHAVLVMTAADTEYSYALPATCIDYQAHESTNGISIKYSSYATGTAGDGCDIIPIGGYIAPSPLSNTNYASKVLYFRDTISAGTKVVISYITK